PVAPEPPTRSLLADLRRREPLVVAVIPLPQLVHDLGRAGQSRELARLPRAQQWAAEHERERPPAKFLPHRSCALAPFLDQRQVGAAGVLAAEAPLRLAVADEHDLLWHSAVARVVGL